MVDPTVDELERFVVDAKARTYAAGGGSVPSAVPGEYEHGYERGPWRYRDRYVGGADFCGQEVVWHRDVPVWAMVYYGAILRPDAVDAATTGRVIKAALTSLYAQGRFLGGWRMEVDGWRYDDVNSGDVSGFTGEESISLAGDVCYRLWYAGGRTRE
ncbi:MAG: DUF5680 domain-containing protein [Candidatus Dormibacteria bacterium]